MAKLLQVLSEEHAQVMLSERVAAGLLERSTTPAQLIERMRWATEDAEGRGGRAMSPGLPPGR